MNWLSFKTKSIFIDDVAIQPLSNHAASLQSQILDLHILLTRSLASTECSHLQTIAFHFDSYNFFKTLTHSPWKPWCRRPLVYPPLASMPLLLSAPPLCITPGQFLNLNFTVVCFFLFLMFIDIRLHAECHFWNRWILASHGALVFLNSSFRTTGEYSGNGEFDRRFRNWRLLFLLFSFFLSWHFVSFELRSTKASLNGNLETVGVPTSVPVRVANELLLAGHRYLDVRSALFSNAQRFIILLN